MKGGKENKERRVPLSKRLLKFTFVVNTALSRGITLTCSPQFPCLATIGLWCVLNDSVNNGDGRSHTSEVLWPVLSRSSQSGPGTSNPACWWIHLHQVIPRAHIFQFSACLGITSLSSSMWLFSFKLLIVFLFKYLRMLIAMHII